MGIASPSSPTAPKAGTSTSWTAPAASRSASPRARQPTTPPGIPTAQRSPSNAAAASSWSKSTAAHAKRWSKTPHSPPGRPTDNSPSSATATSGSAPPTATSPPSWSTPPSPPGPPTASRSPSPATAESRSWTPPAATRAPLTDQRGDQSPAWRPRGDRLVFVRRAALHTVNCAGGDAEPLPALPTPAGAPAYAPTTQGPLLAFHLHQAGNWNIAVANLHTAEIRLLTEATWISWNARA